MGVLQDFLYGKEQEASFQGFQGQKDVFNQAQQMQTPDYSSLIGSVGQGSLASGSREYLNSLMGGAGTNPYETQAFGDFRTATLNQTRQNLGSLSSTLGGSGLLRGSGAERLAGDVVGQSMNQLGAQGFQAQQAGLQRAYGAALQAPGIELAQQGLQGGLMGQGFQNQLQMTGLQGQLAQGISQQYAVPERGGGFLDVLGGAAGVASNLFGIPGFGSMVGLPQLGAQQQ